MPSRAQRRRSASGVSSGDPSPVFPSVRRRLLMTEDPRPPDPRVEARRRGGCGRRTAGPTSPHGMPTWTSSGGQPTTLVIMRTPSSRSTSAMRTGSPPAMAAPLPGLCSTVDGVDGAAPAGLSPLERSEPMQRGQTSRGKKIATSQSMHHCTRRRALAGGLPEGLARSRRRPVGSKRGVAFVVAKPLDRQPSAGGLGPEDDRGHAREEHARAVGHGDLGAGRPGAAPPSPRSWRTASTSRNMPYMPGWV